MEKDNIEISTTGENMKILAINGSPRRKANTATLLNDVLEGVKSKHPEAETRLVHLYDLNFTGCRSCFACKLKGGASYGKCAVKDDIAPLLSEIGEDTDALVFGSPIYFGDITGELRSFLERLLFQWYVYDKDFSTLAPKEIPTAFIYTMNVKDVDTSIRSLWMKSMNLKKYIRNTDTNTDHNRLTVPYGTLVAYVHGGQKNEKSIISIVNSINDTDFRML